MFSYFHRIANRTVLIATLIIIAFPGQAQTQLPTDQEFVGQLIVKLKPKTPALDSLRIESESPAILVEPAGPPTQRAQELISRVLKARMARGANITHPTRLLKSANNADQDIAENMRMAWAIDNNTAILSVGGQVSHPEAEQLIKDIAADEAVEYVEPDIRVHHFLEPNDLRYQEQWGYSTGIGGANLPTAWQHTLGSENIVVAVIDTGYLEHADLMGNILVPGYNFISNSFSANHVKRGPDAKDPGDWITYGEGARVKDCGGRTADSSWHGSHVAGIVGAVTNNRIGVAGISWQGKILPVRVLGKCGGLLSDVITGMRWAAGLLVYDEKGQAIINDRPARVLNLSLGGRGLTCPSAFADAIKDIKNRGAVVVVAAGNSTEDAAYSPPANCDGVIAVGAIDSYGKRAPFSNYGPKVTISAPGVNILSTVDKGKHGPLRQERGEDGDSYVFYHGTSMAAPHVTGTIALMLALNPQLAPDQIVSILKTSAKPFPQGSDCAQKKCGAGILDAGRAVELVKQGGI